MTSESFSAAQKIRSVRLENWPTADRLGWDAALRASERLRRGGAASHLKDVTRRDLARRYGYFLDYVQRTEEFNDSMAAAAYVTPERIAGFLTELQGRVSSVTVYGTIYKVRRVAQLLVPAKDFTWLCEIEKDLGLVMQPGSKADRLVYSNVLAETGFALMVEADAASHWSVLARARQYRNGLMVAFLAFHPMRLKNFAALSVGGTFRNIKETWWIVLPATDTKENRPDERKLVEYLAHSVEHYLAIHRPVLARGKSNNAFWLSSNDGEAMTYSAVGRVVSTTTLASIGVDISPHLFRTSAVSTVAVYRGKDPHLGSALLHHTDRRVREKHYNYATNVSAAQKFADLIIGLHAK